MKLSAFILCAKAIGISDGANLIINKSTYNYSMCLDSYIFINKSYMLITLYLNVYTEYKTYSTTNFEEIKWKTYTLKLLLDHQGTFQAVHRILSSRRERTITSRFKGRQNT